jgi:hypothetical protein
MCFKNYTASYQDLQCSLELVLCTDKDHVCMSCAGATHGLCTGIPDEADVEGHGLLQWAAFRYWGPENLYAVKGFKACTEPCMSMQLHAALQRALQVVPFAAQQLSQNACK